MVWRATKDYMMDGLFVLGGIAVGGPTMVLMANVFAGCL